MGFYLECTGSLRVSSVRLGNRPLDRGENTRFFQLENCVSFNAPKGARREAILTFPTFTLYPLTSTPNISQVLLVVSEYREGRLDDAQRHPNQGLSPGRGPEYLCRHRGGRH